jgi:hypothetical protein
MMATEFKAVTIRAAGVQYEALIANACAILGPGFFAPARNHEVINWLLENGFQIGWPANLMTIGPYQEPLTPFLPSLAY